MFFSIGSTIDDWPVSSDSARSAAAIMYNAALESCVLYLRNLSGFLLRSTNA